MKWKPGESGNPKGRTANPISERFRLAAGSQLEAVIEAMIVAAKKGDSSAAKILLDRCIPPFKPMARTEAFPISGQSLTERAESILNAVSAGTLAPADGKALIDSLATLARITETDELERRVEALEKAKHETL